MSGTQQVRPGDPDPCPRERGKRDMCRDVHGAELWVCSRVARHRGQHIAGTGRHVCAVWPGPTSRLVTAVRRCGPAVVLAWCVTGWAAMVLGHVVLGGALLGLLFLAVATPYVWLAVVDRRAERSREITR
jgi:hypothetical protein